MPTLPGHLQLEHTLDYGYHLALMCHKEKRKRCLPTAELQCQTLNPKSDTGGAQKGTWQTLCLRRADAGGWTCKLFSPESPVSA